MVVARPRTISRQLLMLMPAAMRGIGAHRRRVLTGVKCYTALGYKDSTTWRLVSDHEGPIGY
jgi:hypothetical protein